jgi:hypothetical protein
MRVSVIRPLIVVIVAVAMSGCYSSGQWHLPSWNGLSSWRKPKNDPQATAMAGGPRPHLPSAEAAAAANRTSAPPFDPKAPYQHPDQTGSGTYPTTATPMAGPVAARDAGPPYDPNGYDGRGGTQPRSTPAYPAAHDRSGYPSGGRYDGRYEGSSRLPGGGAGDASGPTRYQESNPSTDSGTLRDRSHAAAAAYEEPGPRRASAPARRDLDEEDEDEFEDMYPRRSTAPSAHQGGETGYPGRSHYEPGNTGYVPPANRTESVRPDVDRQPSTGARSGGFRPGGTSDFQPLGGSSPVGASEDVYRSGAERYGN